MKFFGYDIQPVRLLCFFGRHRYTGWFIRHGRLVRWCLRCGKKDIAASDELKH